MAKLYALFDVSKFETRKTADQEEFEELHRGDLQEFAKIFKEAFSMMKEESADKPQHFKNKNYHATVMSGNVAGLLRENFPNAVKDGPHDRLMFSREGKFCLYFKKLDGRKKPSNVRTEYAELVAYQKTIKGGDKMPIIFIGYTVDDSWSELTGFYAVYIDNGKRVWVTTFSDESDSSNGTPVVDIKPIEPVAPRTRVARVKRKTGS